MALRWKKNEPPTGLARVWYGAIGSKLRIDGETQVASVNAHKNPMDEKKGWYWVAVCQERGVPHYNSCNETPCETEKEAKDAAMKYVRKHLFA